MELIIEIVKSLFWIIVIFILLFDGYIADWFEAKADKLRAEAEALRKENDNGTLSDND